MPVKSVDVEMNVSMNGTNRDESYGLDAGSCAMRVVGSVVRNNAEVFVIYPPVYYPYTRLLNRAVSAWLEIHEYVELSTSDE